MDEDLKEAIAARVTAVLQKAPGGVGMKDAELLGKVHECESAAQLRTVLGQMKRAGQVTQNTTTGRWALTISGVAGQVPGKLETPPPAPSADKQPKRHLCAAAILEALAGAPQLRLGELEQHELLLGKWKLTTIGYHVKCLVKAGEVKPGENRLGGFSLATGAPIAPRAAATDHAPRKKKAARQAPKAARLTAAAERKAQASESPAKPSPTPTEDLSLTMRCPNGHLTISGSRVLVFGFLDQLKAMAA